MVSIMNGFYFCSFVYFTVPRHILKVTGIQSGYWNQTMCITQVRIKTHSNKYICRNIRTRASNCDNVSVRRRRYSSGTKIRTNCQTNFSSIINIDTFPKDT